ncbi:MAG TPA: Do family serine endopeptidase [Chthonomonadales bacterium]|nr:Do family serine endopeptidase [Chthonomonadales bacterium]
MFSSEGAWWKSRSRIFIGALIALALVCVIGISRSVWAAGDQGKASTGAKTAPILPGTQGLVDLENGFVAIAEKMEPSVVSITVKKTIRATGVDNDLREFFFDFRGLPGAPDFPRIFRQMPRQFAQGAGSGVIVREDGWILTNDHVVSGADKVTVKLHDGREFDGTVRRDYRSDIALVKINASNLTPAEFADSDQVRVGQWAIAFGAPFELQDTMTVGIVSAVSRQTTISDRGQTRFYPSLIQTDASINPGNSGGPLVDIRGRVIGINVAINSPTGGSVGIGFAIPSRTAKMVMEQLITKGKVTRGYLGVLPRALTPDERRRYGVPRGGALITSVSADTPAARAGLQVEDVVLRFDGQPVKDDIHFRELVATTPPGKTVEIVVRRDNREQTLRATLDSAPDLLARTEPPAAGEDGGKLGVRVEPITPEAAKKYNLGNLNTGVVVVEVLPGSPADEVGLQPGDAILRANRRPIKSAEELANLVKSLQSGDSVALVVQRGKDRILLTPRIP